MAVKLRSLVNVKIVVVEDLADIRRLITRFLSDQGAQIFAAKNAFEGLRLVAAGFRMHLEKPFTPDQLLATIDLALQE